MEKLEIPANFILTAPIRRVINLIAPALIIFAIGCGGELPTDLEESSTDNTERFTFTGFDGGTFFETWLAGGSVLEPSGFDSRELDSDIPVVDLTDLAAYWKMDSSPISDGMTVQDLTGNFNGTFLTGEGATDKITQGIVTSAIILDGIDDYIDLGAGNSIAQNISSITMIAWINPVEPPAAGESATIFYLSLNGDPLESRAKLVIDENGVIEASGASQDTTPDTQFCSSGEVIVPYNWFHIVGIIDYESDLIEIYVNGRQLAVNNVSFLNASTPDTTSDVAFLGAAFNKDFLSGYVDDVSVFHRRLTAAEISKIYEEQLPATSGYFESEIFDAGKPISWDTISWVPESPSFKELPGGGKTETDYSNGNVSSAGNVLLMHMNETLWNGVTGEVLDASGRGNHGTSNGGATTSPSGKFSRAGEFDGDDDVVTFPSEETSEITISAWIYRSGKNGNPQAAITSASENYLLVNQTFAQGHGVTFVSRRSSANGIWMTDRDVLSLHQWFHVAVTYDSSSITNVPLIHVNGSDIGPLFKITTPEGAPFPGVTGYIGNNPSPDRGFQGYIDEIAIWNRILSEIEIEDLFERGSNRIRFQVRSCGDLTCSATPDFIGPDGTTGTYYSELLNTSIGLPSISLINVISRRYFQYRAYLDQHSWLFEPAALKNVDIKGSWAR